MIKISNLEKTFSLGLKHKNARIFFLRFLTTQAKSVRKQETCTRHVGDRAPVMSETVHWSCYRLCTRHVKD